MTFLKSFIAASAFVLAGTSMAVATPGGLQACGGQRTVEQKPVTDAMQVVSVPVDGMTCGGCAQSIANSLLDLKGIARADIQHEKKLATITYDPAAITVDAIVAAIKKTGYKPGAPSKPSKARQA